MGFVYSQLFVTPKYPTQSYAGKTVIVTGANVGLGRDAARHFARLGAATVILAVRNLSTGNEAKEWIEASVKCGKDVVQVWQLDLLSFDSVKAFAKRVEGLSRVDAIVENAGVAKHEFKLVEGHESTITTNVISTFLLALLVLPKLKEVARKFNIRPYLTIVSSEVHFWTNLPERESPDGIFKTLASEKNGLRQRYEVSKLLEVFTVREIVDGIIKDKDNYPVVINMVNPGLCASSLSRDSDSWVLELMKILIGRKTEVGSRTLVNAAGEIGENSQGQYLSDCKIVQPSQFVRSEEGKKTQKRVWEELSQILESIAPGVTKNI